MDVKPINIEKPDILLEALQIRKPQDIKLDELPPESPSLDAPKTEKTEDIAETIDFSKLINKVNQYVRTFNTKVVFSYDEERERNIIQVKDQDTGQIIREIPPKEMLDLLSKLEDISGIIFHKTS